MSASIKKLYRQDNNPYQLEVLAGKNGIRNTVSWMFMLEDENIVSWFHGAELVVTTGMKTADDPKWLLNLIGELVACRAAGLIVNIGGYIKQIPQEVLDYCNLYEFPLLTMPWEMQITQLIQDFCLAIISDRNEGILHDQAVRDAILGRGDENEYRDVLARHYDLEGKFLVVAIYAQYRYRDRGAEETENANLQSHNAYWLETRLSRLRTSMNLPKARIGIVDHEHMQLLIINNAPREMLRRIRDVVLEVYADSRDSHDIYVGIGIEAKGVEQLAKSYQRAVTAMRMARYRGEPVVRFEDMGFYKILFSVKDEKVLYAYADEILEPLEVLGEKREEYTELLRLYIHYDRSLAETAQALYLHRNTVNYRIQKLRELFKNPLKTPEELFPFQVAFAIRDMQRRQREQNGRIG